MISMRMTRNHECEFFARRRFDVVHDSFHGPNLTMHVGAEINQDVLLLIVRSKTHQEAIAKAGSIHSHSNVGSHWLVPPVNAAKTKIACRVKSNVRSQRKRVGHVLQILALGLESLLAFWSINRF